MDRLAAELGDDDLEHLDVLIEADRGDRARLLGAEQLAAAADLEVGRRDLEPRAELGEPLQGLEPAARLIGDVLGLRDQEVAVRAVLAAADPAAQLVELGQAERVGARHEHRVGARDVEAALDDRGRDQDVELAAHEREHHRLELVGRQRAVADADPRRGHQLADVRGPLVDRAIVVARPGAAPRLVGVGQPHVAGALAHVADRRRDEEHLAAAADLALDRVADRRVVDPRHEGTHCAAVGRRCRDQRQVAQVGHRQVQRARDRRRGQRQHVDLGPRPLDPLLVGDPEALLLVDHQQTEVLPPHVGRQQPVGADHDVELALGEPADRLELLGAALEPRQLADVERERREPLGHGAEVLLDQHRGRCEHAGLLAALHGAVDRAQRDLGLAVADVAAHQPVHRTRRLHVGEHRLDRGGLVGGLVERERRLELAEAVVGGREAMAGQGGALGVELEQLLGERADVAGDFTARELPGQAAELVELGRVALGADVALDLAEPVHRQVQRAAVVLELERVDPQGADFPADWRISRQSREIHPFARRRADLDLLEALVAADAVALVDQVIARREHREVADPAEQRVARALALALGVVRALAEHVGGGHDRDPVAARREAVGRRARDQRDAIDRPGPLTRRREPDLDAARREHAEQPVAAALRIARDRDPQPVAAPPLDRGDQRLRVLDVAERAGVIELGAQHPQIVDLDAHPDPRRVMQLERGQLDPPRRGERAELVDRHQVARRRIGQLLAAPLLGVAPLGVGPGVTDRAAARLGIDDQPARPVAERQIRRRCDQLVVKRRGQRLDADEHLALLELLDQPARRLGRERDLVGVGAQPAAHVARAGVDRLAHRMEVDPLDRAQRALRLGVEPAQRIDLVAEQLDPHRVRRERRVDVDHPAAHRERARFVDHGRAGPAACDQQPGELVAIDHLALAQGPAARGELGGRHGAPDQRLGRGHHQPRPQRGLGQPVQCRDPLDDAHPVRRQVGIRRHVDPGQRGDLVERGGRIGDPAAEEPDVRLEPARRGIVGCDHDHHGAVAVDLGQLCGEPRRPPRGRAVDRHGAAGRQRCVELGPHRARTLAHVDAMRPPRGVARVACTHGAPWAAARMGVVAHRGALTRLRDARSSRMRRCRTPSIDDGSSAAWLRSPRFLVAQHRGRRAHRLYRSRPLGLLHPRGRPRRLHPLRRLRRRSTRRCRR